MSAALATKVEASDPWMGASRAAIVDLVKQALNSTATLVDAPPESSIEGALVPIIAKDLPSIQVGFFGTTASLGTAARALLMMSPNEPLAREDLIDAIREISNMLTGSMKGRVTPYAAQGALGLPTYVHGPLEAAFHQHPEAVAARFPSGEIVWVVVIRG